MNFIEARLTILSAPPRPATQSSSLARLSQSTPTPPHQLLIQLPLRQLLIQPPLTQLQWPPPLVLLPPQSPSPPSRSALAFQLSSTRLLPLLALPPAHPHQALAPSLTPTTSPLLQRLLPHQHSLAPHQVSRPLSALVPSLPSPLSSFKSSFAFEASINRSWNGRLWLLRKRGPMFINLGT